MVKFGELVMETFWLRGQLPEGVTRDAFVYALLEGTANYRHYPEREDELLWRCYEHSRFVVDDDMSVEDAMASLLGSLRFLDVADEVRT